MANLRRIMLLMVMMAWVAGGCAAPKGVYHTVQRGQTLFRIGRVYQVDVNKIARINRLQDRSQLEVGQRLFIPGAGRIRYVPPTALAGSEPVVASAPAKKEAMPASKRPLQSPARPPAPEKVPVPAARGDFVWPVRGTLLKKFGQNGQHAIKGIEIAATGGGAIVAAAAGKVTYSGDGIKGYGNLLILKHDRSYFTVYGFNRQNLVHTGSFVSQGQKIALAGRPPGGGQPRLYFEIRRGKEAVDPLKLLP